MSGISVPGFTDQTSFAILVAFFVVSFFTVFFWCWSWMRPSDEIGSIKKRVISWWVILILYILIMGINPIVTVMGLGFISFLALRELISQIDLPLQSRRTIFWAYLAIPFQYGLSLYGDILAFSLFIPVGMFFLLPFRNIIEGIYEQSIKTYSQLYWGLMLTVYCPSYIAFLAFLPNVPGHQAGQQGVVFFLIFLTQMGDVFQFLTGKVFGKRKITPRISPNKTWEGFIGGFFCTLILGYFLAFLIPLGMIQVLVLSGLIFIFGFFGDLNISSVKRDLKIKDMSDFIPGHGGVLDRLDSLIFSSLAFFYAYYYLVYIS